MVVNKKTTTDCKFRKTSKMSRPGFKSSDLSQLFNLAYLVWYRRWEYLHVNAFWIGHNRTVTNTCIASYVREKRKLLDFFLHASIDRPIYDASGAIR